MRYLKFLTISLLTLSAMASEPAIEHIDSVHASATRIDQLVESGLSAANQKPNALASDEQFVRRVYLDIAGRIPTAEEASSFLKDGSSEKRAHLIDRLIGSDGYNSQMYNWLTDMLRVMDKQGKRGRAFLYEEWLKEQISKNRPWDVIVKQMLTAEGRSTANGPVGYLLRDKKMPLDNLSNTLTVFLGANVACAQCHDHPTAKWTQREFYEMAAFFGATDTDDNTGEKIAKKLVRTGDFDKQFVLRYIQPNTDAVSNMNKNKTTFPKDYKYDNAKPGAPVSPKLIEWSKGDASLSAYNVDTSSPVKLRESFATWLTHKDNPRFATSIANRVWKRIFGLAVQEPVTDLDELNGPNPELLAYLSSEMKRVNFDLREFQRIIFNTQSYQRQASMTPDLEKGPYLFPGPLLRRMTAEQTWDSVLTLAVGKELDVFALHRGDEIRRINIPDKELNRENIVAFLNKMKAEGSPKQGGKAKQGKRSNESEDYDGVLPPHFEGLTLARASELPVPAEEAHFLRMFGQSDRQVPDGASREGNVPQVLAMMNGKVQAVLSSEKSQVLKDVAKRSSANEKIDSLYFSFFSRHASPAELSIVNRALNSGMKLPELTWVLFNSREFIFIQ